MQLVINPNYMRAIFLLLTINTMKRPKPTTCVSVSVLSDFRWLDMALVLAEDISLYKLVFLNNVIAHLFRTFFQQQTHDLQSDYLQQQGDV